jgi:hypothetical protein
MRYLEKAELLTILEESRVARFCCHNEDGTIHATPVWYRYINGNIVVLTPSHSLKARNVKHNNNVTVLIDVEKPARGVMIYGIAELVHSDVLPMAISIGEKYMSKERATSFSQEMIGRGMDLIITVKPERMVTFGM